MSTSAHTSSTAYFNRMKEEGRWNYRRRTGGVKSGPGPRGTVNQVTAQEEALWSEAQREFASTWFASPETADLDGGITSATLWYCGSWKNEAKEFFALLRRGVSDLEKLRSDIGISDAQLLDINAWIAWRPNLESRIRRMIGHRARVLDEFNRLLAESEAALTTPQTAAAD